MNLVMMLTTSVTRISATATAALYAHGYGSSMACSVFRNSMISLPVVGVMFRTIARICGF